MKRNRYTTITLINAIPTMRNTRDLSRIGVTMLGKLHATPIDIVRYWTHTRSKVYKTLLWFLMKLFILFAFSSLSTHATDPQLSLLVTCGITVCSSHLHLTCTVYNIAWSSQGPLNRPNIEEKNAYTYLWWHIKEYTVPPKRFGKALH